ncbi:GD17884 [Drosophila simulans]|uniref:Aminopeptidase n=1 Tax=Drosophila simulans TaxID=7240 RepID=B4QZJ2_DROSI|nr:GD17884 [Drosophila simulans]
MKCVFLILAALGLSVAEGSTYDHFRLPTALRPQRYDVRLLTQLENPDDFRFNGTVKIQIEVLQNTHNITVHSKDLTIDDTDVTLSQIGGEATTENCITSTAVNPTHDFYILNTCKELLAGQVYELSLPFSAKLQDQLAGYYRSSYVDTVANETRWISVTQFEPASARLAFPCFDEPGYKASFAITLGYHKKYTGLSNMPVKETRPHESIPDYVWTAFEESLPMSTYLVAYSLNDFSHKPSTLPNGTLFRTWARPNAIDQCGYAAEFGPKVLNYYEELFGIKFPLPKVDQIAVPDFNAGAMENWGLVTFAENALLYSPEYSALEAKQATANIVAHELAHQWFGNLVTMKWWTDLWLNEGFATYVASLCVEDIHPEWRTLQLESMSNLLTIFRKDSLESSHPISRPIEMTSQISESFDEISYQKGSSVIRMMHLFLGEEAFRTGLNHPKTIQDLPGPDQWVIFNNQLSAPYKVNYDAQNWKLLIETLNSEDYQSIHVVNRAQLIDDVMYFAWTGEQNYEIALQVISYLERERELLPWKSAFDNLKFVNGILRQSSNFKFFKSFTRRLITPIYEHLNGINDTVASEQQQDKTILKAMVADWACLFEVSDCIAQALSYYRSWRSEANPDEVNPVPLGFRDVVYCTAIKHGSVEDWDFLWTRYQKANVATEKQIILDSLGCSQEVWVQQRYLERNFDGMGDIRKQDSTSVFQAIATSEVGFLLAKKYLMDNVDSISKFYHPQSESLSELLPPLCEQIFTRRDYDEFMNFLASSKEQLKDIEQTISQSLETMLINVQWKERNYERFTRAIKKYV